MVPLIAKTSFRQDSQDGQDSQEENYPKRAIINCGGTGDHGVWLENLPICFVEKMNSDFAGGWSSCSVQCFVNAAGAAFSGSSSRAFCVLSFNRFFRVKEYFFGSLLA